MKKNEIKKNSYDKCVEIIIMLLLECTWIILYCGPRISHDALLIDGTIRFLFIWWNFDFFFFLELPFIFVLFLKGKTKYERKTLSVTPEGKTSL